MLHRFASRLLLWCTIYQDHTLWHTPRASNAKILNVVWFANHNNEMKCIIVHLTRSFQYLIANLIKIFKFSLRIDAAILAELSCFDKTDSFMSGWFFHYFNYIIHSSNIFSIHSIHHLFTRVKNLRDQHFFTRPGKFGLVASQWDLVSSFLISARSWKLGDFILN